MCVCIGGGGGGGGGGWFQSKLYSIFLKTTLTKILQTKKAYEICDYSLSFVHSISRGFQYTVRGELCCRLIIACRKQMNIDRYFEILKSHT